MQTTTKNSQSTVIIPQMFFLGKLSLDLLTEDDKNTYIKISAYVLAENNAANVTLLMTFVPL